MIIKTHISFKDFLKFNIKNSLSRIIIFSLILLLFCCLNLYNAENEMQENFKSASVWLAVIIIFMFVRTYFRLKNAFFSNKKIQEQITYIFSNDKVEAKGETFETDFTWNTVFEVKELKDWFLIYQSARTMNMIAKENMDKDQIIEFRKMVTDNGVKSKLRKD